MSKLIQYLYSIFQIIALVCLIIILLMLCPNVHFYPKDTLIICLLGSVQWISKQYTDTKIINISFVKLFINGLSSYAILVVIMKSINKLPHFLEASFIWLSIFIITSSFIVLTYRQQVNKINKKLGEYKK